MPRKSSSRTGKKSSGRKSARTSGSRSRARSSSSRTSSARSSGGRKVLTMPRRHERSAAAEPPAAGGRSAQTRVLSDHDEIRQWAEERSAQPACVRSTGGSEDVGMIRLDFAGYSGEESLEAINWDEWLEKFDDSGLVLLVQDRTASGQKSNFNKLVKRETVESKKSSGKGAGRKRGAA